MKSSLQLVSRILQRKSHRDDIPEPSWQTSTKSCTSVDAALTSFDGHPALVELRMLTTAAERFGIGNPFFKMHEGAGGSVTQINGKEYLNFSHYNYLGLNGHPEVNKAVKEAVERYGTSAGASRLVAGERPVQRALEKALADVYGVDDCVVFVSGHATNVSTISTLFGPGDLILHDSLIHNSVLEGIRLSRAARRPFPHNDLNALDTLLAASRTQYKRTLIVAEGLYSMDGDLPDLPALVDIKRRHGAFLMLDEAHSLGVLGATGRGLVEYYGVSGKDVDIWMGTLSKTLAGCGGYIAGSQALVDILKFAAPGFVYSVGLAPPLAAASLAALRIMLREPERVQRLRERGALFLDLARREGLDVGTSQVLPSSRSSSAARARPSRCRTGFLTNASTYNPLSTRLWRKSPRGYASSSPPCTVRATSGTSAAHWRGSSMERILLMIKNRATSSLRLLLSLGLLVVMLSGCASMPHSGANRDQVQEAEKSRSLEGIAVTEVTDALVRKLSDSKRVKPFAEVFGSAKPRSYLIGPGDTLEITVWETPPSILFGGVALDPKAGALSTSAETLPVQMVMDDGTVNMPFAGRIKVAERSVRAIENDITARLQGKANNPQVMVRVARNPTSQVAIIGDVAKSTNMPLTPKGERLLDALAAAGGVAQPVTKVSLQLSRGDVTASMPLDDIIRESKQNIPLLPGDVLTALFQPWTFSVLGATGKNQEIPFEARGISLAQALARSGGLNDNRADPGGVFVFRFEDAPLVETPAQLPVNGKMPVVYQVNFNDPGAFFVTQNFPVQDKDVIYVANMPSAELAKFLRMLSMVVAPSLSITNTTNTLSQ